MPAEPVEQFIDHSASKTRAPLRHAQTPIETMHIKMGDRVKVAAGMEAITKTLEFTAQEPGLERGAAALLRLNQFDGYDCPGCAWPDPDDERTMNEYCENGAKAIAEETTSARVTPEFFGEWSVSDISGQSDYWQGKQGRLMHPMYMRRGTDHYARISWEDAFDIIAEELNSCTTPDEAVFYTSGRTSNEAAFLYQLFVREFGTNNLPDCSNMCHESSGSALTETIGIGKGSVTLHDFEFADAIFIVGQNPGTNHPRMLTTLQRAARRGCTIVSVNPLNETGVTRFKHPQEIFRMLGSGTKLASHFAQVRINGDMAFFRGLIKEVLEAEKRTPGTINRAFIEKETEGFAEMVRVAEATAWEEIEYFSGVGRDKIREIADVWMKSKNVIVCWAMGLTQHKNSVATIQEIVNLQLLGGHLGRKGAGLCPVRGHSNVQGDRTMGIWEKMPDEFLDKLKEVCGFDPPRKHGWDTVASIKAMERGDVRVFFAMGGNFLSATPDTERTARALANCSLTVHVSTKMNRSHVITGEHALILPCLGRTECDMQGDNAQFVTVENSMGVVSPSKGRLTPASEDLMSEPAIVAHLAARTLAGRTKIDWLSLAADYDRIRDLIAQVVPGCEGYNEKVRHKGGFYLPNGARDGKYRTRTEKAQFTPSPLTGVVTEPGQFLLMTIRSHDQFNTTIYGLDDRYRGVYHGRRVVFMNPDDMAEQGWPAGGKVNITSHHNGTTRTALSFVLVPYEIPRGCTASYFPEANVLVPLESVAEKSNTPTSKSVVVTFAPATALDGVIEEEGLPALAHV
jgi:molybdopterin-dependent oxidoreductase alpha subunit